MAWKNPNNQPTEHVEVLDSEDDGEELGNIVHTPVLHPPRSEPPPQKELTVSEDDESEEEESEEESKEEEEEDGDDEEETNETDGESGEEEEHGSPIRGPTQNKGGVNETKNLTIMPNSTPRNEETDELDKKKMETEMRIEYLGIFLELIEVQRRMLKLKRKARQHNIKINEEEGDGCFLPSQKRCDWCKLLKRLQ